jgi:hypothetical protein
MMTPTRRSLGDRRRRPTPPFSRYLIVGGRRTQRRRIGDPPAFYADRLGGPLLLVLFLVFVLQTLDAHLTLAHLRKGGVELNPIMRLLIAQGDAVFISAKLGVAAIGLAFLGIHQHFPMVRAGLAVIAAIFLAVVGWHCLLAFQMV